MLVAQGEFAGFEAPAQAVQDVAEQVVQHQAGGFQVVQGQHEEERLLAEELAAEREELDLLLSTFQISPLGPRPKDGGSRAMPS
jgi:hypothetical protein